MNAPSKPPADCLRQIAESGEGPYDIALAALMMAALDHSERDLKPHQDHLQDIAEQAQGASRLVTNVADGAPALLAGRYGFDGDRLACDDPQNANLISVIDRRRGTPVALGVLYIHAARAVSFNASGLNSPGHFLLRITFRGSETFMDPFNGGAALEREEFGGPPSTRTVGAEDMHGLQPVTDAEVLLRLQNNLKLLALQSGDNARATEIAERMVLVAPRRPELWMDLARLREGEGSLGAAHKAYETCMTLTKSGSILHNEAALALQGLKRRLN
jgi:regulator of sirC expression with transglutaminase-like and TPR domain